METKKISRNIDIVKNEIDRLRTLICKRTEWLNKPENKMRSTYNVILKDTRELIEHLDELEHELQQYLKKIPIKKN